VLDNTGSMQGAKLASLKEAVGQLLDTLEADVDDPELLKIAVIPFNTQVRISTANANAPWLIPLSASSGNSGTNWLLCQWFPALCAPPPWYGCVTDRTQPNDVTDIGYEPLQRTATGYPAATCAASNGFAQVLPLTSDLDTVRARVEAMTAAGNTNVTIGVAWGMAALSQRAPLTESLPPDETDLRRIMVVLTDGENTENRWTQNTRSIDDRTRLACDSAKASGMLVFTIRVLEGNQDLLEDCASERAYYFNVTDVDDLLPAFEGIARTISRLRVAE